MHSDFDLQALYKALDEKRCSRGLSWGAVTREINRFMQEGHPIATVTITGLRNKSAGEGDGILQMLLWLGRTPESFIPGMKSSPEHSLPQPGKGQRLRWNAKLIYSELNAQRQARGMTWNAVAQGMGLHSINTLTHLAKGGRVGFPRVMRIVRWLKKPAASFTRITDW